MVAYQKAQTLADAYRLLDPLRPLEGEWLDLFYAERPETASIYPLLDELLLDDREDDKTLFTGHRGSGKTTELARLERELASSHIVVRMNVESLLNLGDVDYADLLVVMGLQVYQQARRSGVRMSKKKLDGLRFWYKEHILEEDERPIFEEALDAKVNVGIASFAASLRTNTPRRQHTRAIAQANLADLLERLNDLLAELCLKAKKRILIIVDGLDKIFDLGQVRALFLDGANALLEPRCRVVYTLPISLYYTNDFQQVRLSFHRNFALPNVKVDERDGSPCRDGRQAMAEALEKRMTPSLLTMDATERLVELSGGLFKELISLARVSVLHARRLRGNEGPVQVDDVEYAARQIRNTYRSLLTEEQYWELLRIARGGRFINSALAQELLHNLSLLEYNGEGTWLAVHPIIRPLLDEWAREHEKSE